MSTDAELDALLRIDDAQLEGFERALSELATALLTRFVLVAGGLEHRLVEIELYYYGTRHRDPFAHRHPLQRIPGRWYFHRQGKEAYRGGSFKGLDLTFGEDAFGGVLVRSLRGPNGLIDGPCRVVEHLLELTSTTNVAELDARIDGRLATSEGSPLVLRGTEPRARAIVRTARVGLTLKRCEPESEKPAFLGRRDRFLAEPRAVRAGKGLTAIALFEDGLDASTIASTTGSPRASVEAWIAAFEEGRRSSYRRFVGKASTGLELARLLGALRARFGSGLGIAAPHAL